MKIIITYIFILFSTTIFSQISAVVVDSTNNKGIAYINIWIENDHIGATSNKKGEFTITPKKTSKIIVFSGIGYETKKIKVENLTTKIKLNPIITELAEVELYAKKETKELHIDTFNKSKYHSYYSTYGIATKYFMYQKKYNETPILKTFRILTKSKVKDATFNIRLYTKGNNGNPDKYLHDKNILVTAKKGKNYTDVDVSKLNIKFPKEGFFIAIEWLIIDSNKNEYTYTMSGSKKKYKGINYNPSIGMLPSNALNFNILSKGEWHEFNRKNDESFPFKKYRNKYNQLAIELVLTN